MVEKKKTTKTTRVTKPRKKSTPSTVKVTRIRKRVIAKPESIIDLRNNFSEPEYEQPVVEDIFDESIFSPEEVASEKISEPPKRWSSRLYRNIAVTFVVLSIASLALVAYLTYIRLDIIVEPMVSVVNAKTTFKVYDRPEDYELPAGTTLGLVREMEVESTETVSSTGKKVTGAEVSGTVRIINNYTKNQPLVATTRLLTPNNQLLRLTESVTVPAGGEVQASVYAETADPSFTLADTKLTIPGLWSGLQDKIYAEAKIGSVKYKEKADLFITQADIDQAVQVAKVSILEKAKQDINNVYSAYDQKLFTLKDTLLKTEITGEAGEVKDSVSVTVTGLVTVVAFNSSTVTGIVDTALTAAGSAEAIENQEKKPAFEIVSADPKDNVAEISAITSGLSTPKTVDAIIDLKKIHNLRRNQLEAYLNESPNISSYELKFRPSFWPWSPMLADRIFVSVK